MTTQPSILKPITPGSAWAIARQKTQEEIIVMIKESSLRGRGGAGFPTGIKWDLVRLATGAKTVVCNADEGEPGTFKDQKLLTEYSDTLFEGMAIACHTVGAQSAILYLRYEYHFMKSQLELAMKSAEGRYTGIKFSLFMGAGAYVCGEETALIDSLEGRRGEARNKPPYPGEKGYLDLPTLVNNVETFCCIPHILLEGPAAFASVGTVKSRGMKLFSISGDVAKPGVYELPLGSTLSTLLDKAGAADTKAVLVGGASGVIVKANDTNLNRILAYEDLPPGGAVVVFNNSRKMIDIALNLTEFFVEESCGQCVPCREGNRQLLNFLKSIKENRNVQKDRIDLMTELADVMKVASKCGLGQMAPSPFLTILDQFQDELMTVHTL